MKNLFMIAITLVSFKSLAVGLIPQALCTGTALEETGDGNTMKPVKIKVSSQVNPNNSCVDQSEMDPNAVIVLQNDILTGDLMEDTAAAMTSVMSTSATGETVFTSIDSDGRIMTLTYSITSIPGEAKAMLTGVYTAPVVLECILPHYVMDCELEY